MGLSKYDRLVMPYLDRISTWTMKGADEKEIASKLGVAYSTFRRYLAAGRQGDEKYRALADVMREASKEPNDEVEAALYKLACGYDAIVIKQFKLRHVEYSPEGKRIREWEELVEGKETVYVPANVSAQQFWLSNRAPERWRKQPEPVAPEDEKPVSMTTEEKFRLLEEVASEYDKKGD